MNVRSEWPFFFATALPFFLAFFAMLLTAHLVSAARAEMLRCDRAVRI